jgi:ATP synthase protein I
VDQKETKKQLNAYGKYSTLGIQMAVIIGGCVWLGTFLDDKYNPGGQGWTLGLSLFGVAAALYQVLNGVIRITKDKEKEKESK